MVPSFHTVSYLGTTARISKTVDKISLKIQVAITVQFKFTESRIF